VQVQVVEFDASTPFKDQLEVISQTGVFVSVHTSNLANAQFLQPGSAVFEIIQRNWMWAEMDLSFKVPLTASMAGCQPAVNPPRNHAVTLHNIDFILDRGLESWRYITCRSPLPSYGRYGVKHMLVARHRFPFKPPTPPPPKKTLGGGPRPTRGGGGGGGVRRTHPIRVVARSGSEVFPFGEERRLRYSANVVHTHRQTPNLRPCTRLDSIACLLTREC
jgi:hypothetical protein